MAIHKKIRDCIDLVKEGGGKKSRRATRGRKSRRVATNSRRKSRRVATNSRRKRRSKRVKRSQATKSKRRTKYNMKSKSKPKKSVKKKKKSQTISIQIPKNLWPEIKIAGNRGDLFQEVLDETKKIGKYRKSKKMIEKRRAIEQTVQIMRGLGFSQANIDALIETTESGKSHPHPGLGKGHLKFR